ncbi:hypothetical protein [Acinetobacter ursingii]|uniref:hypothetical protein n=1 Tax=Acinetobacter ursingii TaxID=108980 RepID=UPI00254F8724|nr:hypothetical protein [Acinetobacter ursingii]MEC6128285.1 hypothetical protein [Acinetobacter ursingii]
MQDTNIKAPIFEAAFEDGAYSKPKVIAILNETIQPEKLNDSDETVLGSVLFSINDSALKNLNIFQLIQKIEINKTNASKALVAKILSNPNIHAQMNEYKAQKSKENRKWIIGFFIIVAAIGLILANKFNLIKLPISPAKEGAKVVVLDTGRLAYSATIPYMDKELTPDQAQKVSLKYKQDLQKQLNKYVDNGYIIINKSAVYVTSETNDITDQLIKDLGFKPVDREKFDADYSNQQKYDVLKNFAQINVGEYEVKALDDANKALNQQAEQSLNSAEVITDSDGQSIDLQ